MPTVNPDLLVLAVFVAVGFAFVFLNLAVIAPLLRPRRIRTPLKDMAYECGEEPIGNAWVRFNPRFFLIAIVFVLFEVELAFLFPWAVAYRGAGWIAFADLVVFLAILLAGYAWAWKRGDLRWILPREGAGEDARKAA